jgi:hypothetical protein
MKNFIITEIAINEMMNFIIIEIVTIIKIYFVIS